VLQVLVQAPSTYASCCVSMTGIDRHVYVLPREKAADGDAAVSFGDLYAELRDAVVKVVPPGKGKFMVKKVRKNYAFELPGVPRHETEYLELKYSFKFPALPSDISGRTFSKYDGWCRARHGHCVGARDGARERTCVCVCV
jgi:DNA polymerase alpha subunit A